MCYVNCNPVLPITAVGALHQGQEGMRSYQPQAWALAGAIYSPAIICRDYGQGCALISLRFLG